MKCREIIGLLEQLSPVEYACDWDNVGLMVGDRDREIKKVLITLDADRETVERAAGIRADMIITHHPLIFSDLKSVTTDTLTGSKIYQLIQNNICCYSMHTNFDTKGGMAEEAAKLLEMPDSLVLEVTCEEEGIGRYAECKTGMTVREWAEKVKKAFDLPQVFVYGDLQETAEKVAVVPGSGKGYIRTALEKGVELLITGDIGYHDGTEAKEKGLNIIDAGHYGTEHIFIDYIYNYLNKHLEKNQVEIIADGKKNPYTAL